MNVLRTLLVLLNVVVAIRAPYFSGVLGAVGGLTDAFLCFVLPPLIYRSALGAELTTLPGVFYLLVTGWGFLVILHTFYHLVDLAFPSLLGN